MYDWDWALIFRLISEVPMIAAFTILEYKKLRLKSQNFLTVGTCVLFDPGGISLKDSTICII